MSVMERRIACPGSAQAEKGLPDRGSAASDRGTRLHDLAARALLGDEGAAYEPDDPEDSKMVVDYVDAVRAELLRYERGHLLGNCGTPTLYVEQRFHLDHLDEELWGTADAMIVAPPFIHVFDLKTGYVAVDLMKDGAINAQLGGYLLGGIRAAQKLRADALNEFRLTVVQPARGGSKTIVAHRKLIAQLAGKIVDTLEAARQPNAPRSPGDHCGYCKARGTCPALRESALGEAQAFFKDEDMEEPLQEVVEIDDADLAKLIALGERVDAWLKAVRAEAWHRLNEGTPVPGLKLVAKRATRKWRDEAAALQRLRGEGLEDVDLYTRKLKGPAGIEKISKELKPLVAELCEKTSTGAKLVPEDHPDPALPVGAAAVFNDATDE
jgi:hypothetical protein